MANEEENAGTEPVDEVDDENPGDETEDEEPEVEGFSHFGINNPISSIGKPLGPTVNPIGPAGPGTTPGGDTISKPPKPPPPLF